MLNFLKNKNGQNTAEYAILIALVIGAAVAMQTYVKRGMQGGVKYAVDKLKKSNSGKEQYEPDYLESSYEKQQSGYQDTVKTEEGGKVTRTIGTTDRPHVTTITSGGYQKMKYNTTTH